MGACPDPCAADAELGPHYLEDLSSPHHLPLYLDRNLGSFEGKLTSYSQR